ncbi:MAG TPA: hypothetical protein VMU66_06835 [Gaiellales bacterium]|nr:hypothetical protein [Gaiellales bacterium]
MPSHPGSNLKVTDMQAATTPTAVDRLGRFGAAWRGNRAASAAGSVDRVLPAFAELRRTGAVGVA